MPTGYVLVIEDDPDIRGIVVDYLRRAFPDVREACDGADALALLESVGWPSVVLTDIVMPGVLGTTVAEYVSLVSAQQIPLAFVTGSPEKAPQGATVFPKPAKLSALFAFVEVHHVT